MKAVFVATPTLAAMFRDVGVQLRASGREVIYFDDPRHIEQPQTLSDADILVIGSNFKCDHAALEGAHTLRAVIYGATGTDGIDLAAANKLGIVVGHGPTPENYRSMAEATILLMLALLYDLRGSEQILRRDLPRPTSLMPGRMLAGRTVGLVGFGRIARVVADNLASWNVALQTFTRSADPAPIPAHVKRVSLDELMATSDIVSIHATHNAESVGLIGERQLRLMNRSAFLVNTARGSIVDEKALIRALLERRIAGAALDTFEIEPLPADSPLRGLDNVILTPHLIGHTQDLMASLAKALLENIERALSGTPPRYVRNPEVIPRWLSKYGHGSQAAHPVH
jgi:D-3-phosphoglycerate dehydrogenase